ncbi:DUF817 domain-containing protein [Hyphomicrobium sp. CS1BSMeth3]|uniref:DUF817 domain-containing protein n=1 Tax=Hyphomicrobium sp. CS1BSMeth3 TaxID=1892844 RepID=UPI00092FE030|nr:DUF817 domain-containing protein [Hyphomicrobium sp. CS1BSMeth3]
MNDEAWRAEAASTTATADIRRRDIWLAALKRHSERWLLPLPLGRVWHELLLFGVLQAWACLFAGILLLAIVTTKFAWPLGAPIARYDFLFLVALSTQGALLALKMERIEEAKVILIFHVVATIMELFKTAKGSWIYPEANLIRIAGVPLFSGFMYSAVGSYIARCWRLFDFRFSHYPPIWTTWLLAALIYVNFFTHHYVVDLRYGLFAFAALIYGRTVIHFTIDEVPRRMPLLLGFFLVSLFIWFAENISSFSAVWLYPHQLKAWSPVSLGKLGAWFLLMIISFVLVASVHAPKPLNSGNARG